MAHSNASDPQTERQPVADPLTSTALAWERREDGNEQLALDVEAATRQ